MKALRRCSCPCWSQYFVQWFFFFSIFNIGIEFWGCWESCRVTGEFLNPQPISRRNDLKVVCLSVKSHTGSLWDVFSAFSTEKSTESEPKSGINVWNPCKKHSFQTVKAIHPSKSPSLLQVTTATVLLVLDVLSNTDFSVQKERQIISGSFNYASFGGSNNANNMVVLEGFPYNYNSALFGWVI